jgi:two-component system LytT family sensor kinase
LPSLACWVYSVIYAASVAAIGIELKVFNSVRIQIKLEEQERLLLHARMEALLRSRYRRGDRPADGHRRL